MDNTSILVAVIAIAALALIGRMVINKHKAGDKSWRKVSIVMVAAAAYMVAFMAIDPYGVKMWWRGEASLAEGQTENIAGRTAGADIPRLASADSTTHGFYYVPEGATYEPTGYCRLKHAQTADNETERKVSETEAGGQVIERKMSMFEITHRPTDQDKYLHIGVLTFADSTKILVATEEVDPREMPVCIVRPTTQAYERVLKNSNIRPDVYLLAFNEEAYTSDTIGNIIERSIAGLAAAVLAAGVFVVVIKKRK